MHTRAHTHNTQRSARKRFCCAMHFTLPFLSVILLRQRGGPPYSTSTCIGMQTYLQIVSTVCFSIERNKNKVKLFHLASGALATHSRGGSSISSQSYICVAFLYIWFCFVLFFISFFVPSISCLWKMMSFLRVNVASASGWWKERQTNDWLTAKSTKISARFCFFWFYCRWCCDYLFSTGHDHDRRDHNVNVQEQRATHCMRAKPSTTTPVAAAI